MPAKILLSTAILLGCATFGCGDGDADSGAPDSGATAADAAGASDAAMERCTADGPAGVVTVEKALSPWRTPEVLVHAPDGSLLSTTTVDDAGEAAVEVPPCGMVTLAMFEELGSRASLVTWVDLLPGDRLVAPTIEVGRYLRASISVDFAPYAGADSYAISTTGDAANATDSPVVLDARTLDSEIAVVGIASAGGVDLAWAGATATGGAVSLGAWSTDFADVSPTVTGIPPEVTSVGADMTLVDGDDFVLWRTNAYASPVGGSAAFADLLIPNGFAQGITTVRLEHGDIDFVQVGRFASEQAVSLTADQFLPMPETFEISGPLPRQTLTWSAAGGAGEATIVILEANDDWWVIAPVTATALEFPEVPVELQRSEPMYAHTIALGSPAGAADYREALPLLPAVNAVYFTPLQSADRISLIGDLDPYIIELP